MPNEFSILARIIPDFSRVEKEAKKEIDVKANIRSTSPLAVAGGGKVGGLPSIAPAGEAGGLSAGIIAIGMGIFEVIKKIFSFISGLEPIKAMMDVISTIMKLFLMPLAIGLMNLLMPSLMFILRLMPYWLAFWRDPIGNLKKALAGLPKAILNLTENLPEWTGQFSTWLWNEATKVFTLENLAGFGEWLWNLITVSLASEAYILLKFGEWLWNTITSLFTLDNLAGFGRWLNEQITGIISSGLNILAGFATWLWNKITAGISTGLNILSQFTAWLWNTIVGNFIIGMSNLANFGTWLWDTLTGLISSGLSIIGDLGKAIWNGIIDAMQSIPVIGQYIPNSLKVKDVIITDTGQIIEPSSNDYIMAVDKNNLPLGGNKEVNVYLNVSGLIDSITLRQIANEIRYEIERVI